MRHLINQQRLSGARYLLLSMITGVVELGVILFAARSGWSLPFILGLGLTYQLAALFVRPFALSAKHYRLLLVGGVAVGAAAIVTPYAMPLALVISAIGLQGVREEQLEHAKVPTLPKRAARIIGFVVSAAFNPWALFIVPMLALGIAGRYRGLPSGSIRQEWKKPKLSRYAILMVIHQSHYFVYAYSLLFLLARLFAPNALLAVAIFGTGWITYTLAPVFLDGLPTRPTLVAGHILVVFVMAVIAGSMGDRITVAVAWIISGLGGGTVFCIKKLASKTPHVANELDSWENIGHVTGSASALALVLLLPVQYVFVAAGLLAATTAIFAIVLAIPRLGHTSASASREQID